MCFGYHTIGELYLPYSRDLDPCGFFLYPKMKFRLKGSLQALQVVLAAHYKFHKPGRSAASKVMLHKTNTFTGMVAKFKTGVYFFFLLLFVGTVLKRFDCTLYLGMVFSYQVSNARAQAIDTSQHQLLGGDCESGLHGGTAAKKHFLRETKMKKRTAWTKKHKKWILDQWKLEFGLMSPKVRYLVVSTMSL